MPPEYCVKTAVLIGMKPWKKQWPFWFTAPHRMALPRSFPKILFSMLYARKIEQAEHSTVFTWGMKYPPFLDDFCTKQNIPLVHVEDGFIRSLGLGSKGGAPVSLVFDHGLHFNAQQPSRIEDMLQNFAFANHPPAFKERAEQALRLLLNARISKYNPDAQHTPHMLYGEKRQPRIMVLGQVAGDASLRYGNPAGYTPHDLLEAACNEHPDAQIIYRPHPAARDKNSVPPRVIISKGIDLCDDLDSADHVYTITSLAGFEAALRGKTVTLFGTPFYAGWGFTDDRFPLPQRTNRLTELDVFAASYLLYACYFHPRTGARIGFEEALTYLLAEKSKAKQEKYD